MKTKIELSNSVCKHGIVNLVETYYEDDNTKTMYLDPKIWNCTECRIYYEEFFRSGR